MESTEESGREKFGLEFGNEAWRQGGGGKETAFLIDGFTIDGPARTVEQRRTTKKGVWYALDLLQAAAAPE
jgi:hypothetical protein